MNSYMNRNITFCRSQFYNKDRYDKRPTETINIDEFEKLLKPVNTISEYLAVDTLVKPYFDVEMYFPKKEDAPIEEILDNALEVVYSCFQEHISKDQIAVAEAHRQVTKDGKVEFKVSYRLYVPSVVMDYTEIVNLLTDDDEKRLGFDRGVYKKAGQLLGCVGCSKKETSDRVFVPLTEHDKRTFVVQYLTGAERRVYKTAPIKPKVIVKRDCHTDLDQLRSLVMLLNPSRAEAYNTWIDVGNALKSMGEDVALEIWHEFSKQSSKYCEIACDSHWKKLSPKTITVASIYYWAKVDNPEEYHKVLKKEVYSLIFESRLGGTHKSVADVVKAMYKGRFAYVQMLKGSCWYEFTGNRWEELPNAWTLRIEISGKVVEEYKRQTKFYESRINEAEDEDKDKYKGTAKALTAIIKKLEDTGFKDSLVKELGLHFGVSKSWFEALDEKKNLLGFNNGVYDLDTGIFRKGEPSDNLSMTTGYDYLPDINHAVRDHLLEFIRSIMPTQEMEAYLLTMSAYLLHGCKFLEHVNFWIGRGGNGKGLLSSLLTATLGEYCYTPHVSMFTTKKISSSATSSEMVKAKGKRVMIVTEPDEDDKLQAATLKALSGRDKIQARGLYKDFIEFDSQFHIIMQMNNPPSLNGFDNGLCRRLKNVEFPYKFTDNPVLPHEKEADPTLKSKFDSDIEYRQQFMLLILEYYTAHIRNKISIHIPEKVEEFTREYLHQNNVVGQFLSECCDVTNCDDDVISADDLYQEFKMSPVFNGKDKRWFSVQMGVNSYKSQKCKARSPLRDKYVYTGIKLKEPECEVVDV